MCLPNSAIRWRYLIVLVPWRAAICNAPQETTDAAAADRHGPGTIAHARALWYLPRARVPDAPCRTANGGAHAATRCRSHPRPHRCRAPRRLGWRNVCGRLLPGRPAMKAIPTLVVAVLVSFGQPVEADILDADGLAACTEVSNAADRLLASRYVPGFIASLRSAADRGARSTDPYVRNAAQRLRVTTFDEAVPAVKIFMQACAERVAQKPNVQVWGPTAAPPAAPVIP